MGSQTRVWARLKAWCVGQGLGYTGWHREWIQCVWGGWHVCGVGQGPVQEGGVHPDRAGPLRRGQSGAGPFGVATARWHGLGHMGGVPAAGVDGTGGSQGVLGHVGLHWATCWGARVHVSRGWRCMAARWGAGCTDGGRVPPCAGLGHVQWWLDVEPGRGVCRKGGACCAREGAFECGGQRRATSVV